MLSRYTEKLLLAFFIFLSICTFVLAYWGGLTLAFGDATAHLNIARRVVDSPSSGFAQIGGYWLPVFHILMIPFVWHSFFWQTGLAGSVISMASYILTIFFLYKLVLAITKRELAAVLASLVVGLNPNMVLLQTMPMTEPLFIASLVAGTYYFYRFAVSKSPFYLLLTAACYLITSMNRYEGWAVLCFASVVLLFMWVKERFAPQWEGFFLAFSVLAWLGVFLWLVWGAVIFADPFEFLHNELNSHAQTSLQYSGVSVQTGKHNALISVGTNLYSLVHIAGIVPCLLAAIGTTFLLIKTITKRRLEDIVLWALLMPLAFLILSVYLGHVPVEVAELSKVKAPGNIFNIRYSLYTLPAVALFASLISRRVLFIFLEIFLVLGSLFFSIPGTIRDVYLLKDSGTTNLTDIAMQTNASWFRSHYTGGAVLASTGSSDDFMFFTGLPLRTYITEGSYRTWQEALDDPGSYTKWVIINRSDFRDGVAKHINEKRLAQDFVAVHTQTPYIIYVKRD
jgi:hypothetical protein